MGLTQIEELNSMPMRALAAEVILDAIDDAKNHPESNRGKEALFFLSGKNGMCQGWLSCLPDLDVGIIMVGIKKLVGNNFIKPKPKKPRKKQTAIGIKYGDRTITVQQAADMLGFSYSTVYRRQKRYPGYSFDELRSVMPVKKDGRFLRGKR